MAGDEGQESSLTDISETLDLILKGYGSVPDAPDGAGISSLGMGEPNGVRDSPPAPQLPAGDEFVEYFDFSSFGNEDDSSSKVATPDLVSSSSTNPSPESDASSDIKTEEISDLLRLGTWKEIDGGESAFYQSGDWKWDSPMPTLEQPWAIFTS